jgi:hypothetical protein
MRHKLMKPFEKPRLLSDDRVYCLICSSVLKDRKNYRDHVYKRHKPQSSALMETNCKTCGIAFRTGVEWQLHNCKYHCFPVDSDDEDGRPLSPLTLDKIAVDPSIFATAKLIPSTKKNGNWECSLCMLNNVIKKNVKQHVRFAHIIEPYECLLCNMGVRNEKDGKFHVRKYHRQ